MKTHALAPTTAMRTPNARIIREAREALNVRAIPATLEMASTAKVCIYRHDMQYKFV